MPTFADMMDMSIDSSPLKPPSPAHGATPANTTPSRSEPPSPTVRIVAPPVVQNLRKRPAEDMAQFAELTPVEQMISLAGNIAALGQQQKLLLPDDGNWKPGKRLVDKIKAKAITLIADCTIPAYLNNKIGPTKLLMDIVLLRSEEWGFPAKLKDEKYATDILTSVISTACIATRNKLKYVILSSRGEDPADGATARIGALNIVELTHLILSKLKLDPDKADVRMCGRVAILRKLITETNDAGYWKAVDTQLAAIRTKHVEPIKQSRWIKKAMLDPDLAVYGQVDLCSLDTPSVPIAGPSGYTALDDDPVATSD
ncbi:hypothetical protein C8F04DRAFT_1277788 [Mycena alexandri]|uniref:Uncharacterized protein n=1 Tax=Mycena alexandri TaxID=1745969 RepID=A0AAD6S3M9_9AGAR|nr:hypothetical protein C8F04DRAFT_1277788 [Mycena alexandri]